MESQLDIAIVKYCGRYRIKTLETNNAQLNQEYLFLLFLRTPRGSAYSVLKTSTANEQLDHTAYMAIICFGVAGRNFLSRNSISDIQPDLFHIHYLLLHRSPLSLYSEEGWLHANPN